LVVELRRSSNQYEFKEQKGNTCTSLELDKMHCGR
jgi:hypothetical protein